MAKTHLTLILRNGAVKARCWGASSSAFWRALGSPAIRPPTRSESCGRWFAASYEMASSFLEPLGYDETFSVAIEVHIRGLSALRTGTI
jgi:hypothetical protein